MAKTPKPQPVAAVQTEASPEPSAPINFAEPISAADLTAGVADSADEAVPVITADQMRALNAEAHRDNQKRDFTLKVLEARAPLDAGPAAPAPLAPRMAAQTNAEIEAGRKMNEHHAALAARRPAPVAERNATAVFRPEDYVPDQKKGQGHIQAQNL